MTTLSIGYIISIVTTMMILPFPESPRLLLSQGREEELKAAIDFFASSNKVTIDWDKINLESQVAMRAKKSTEKKPESNNKRSHESPKRSDSLKTWRLELHDLPPQANEVWLRRTLTRSDSSDSQSSDRNLINEEIQ